ncbi:MAG: YicC/YloC family endoribonuclease [Acidobacteriota bacterium]
MRSMTGFGQAALETERFRMTVTLRGVNHRFLDLAMRLRDTLRPFEPALRELLSKQLQRGRVEVGIEVEALAARDVEVGVDQEVASAIRQLADDLEGRGVVSGPLQIGDLLRLPEVMKLQVRDPEWTDDDRQALLGVAGDALQQLIAARTTEGEALAAALGERIDGLHELAAQLTERWDGMATELAASLRQRIAQLLDGESPDEDRLAQEVAYLVDKSDVAEELDRLRSHLDHFRSVMGDEGSLGKRLDFLIQEIFRELNTLGAKCRDSTMTRWVLDGKVLCEQLREQVQNVE